MKHLFLLWSLCALSMGVMGQKQPVTLISLGQLTPKSVPAIQSMADGLHYTQLGENGRSIEQYDYATGKKVADLLDLDKVELKDVAVIDGYEVNDAATRILIYTNKKPLYRHSFVADYYVYDMNRRELKPLSEGGGQRMASFSPDGHHVAFVKNNNLHVAKLRFGTVSAITSDGAPGAVINGVPDWVYEEEFKLTQAYAWSPDSREVAFVRFDESAVNTFNFPLYRGSMPANEAYGLYPGMYEYKYPKAGQANARVSVRVFNLDNRTTKIMDIGKDDDVYVPRLMWADAQRVAVVKLNRLQNQLDLLLCHSATTVSTSLLMHRNEFYIGDEVLDNIQFLPDGNGFLYVGEMDGWNHIHHYSMAGTELSQLTKGEYDVMSLLGYDADKKMVYYQAAEESPMCRDIYMVSLSGKVKKKISLLKGTNEAEVSVGGKYLFVISHNATTPPRYSMLDAAGKVLRTIDDNKDLSAKMADYEIASKEYFTFNQTDGVALNGWLMKPAGFDGSKKYPVVLVQYNGPNYQEVLDGFKLGWEQALVTEGFIVACVDGRGTGARGEAFRKSTYMKLGQLESADMVDAAAYLSGLPFVDGSRIGIWGWSYGGYVTLMSMSRSAAFKAGVAIAPLTDWRFYDTAYTERYMRRPSDNEAGYHAGSPLLMAGRLKGRLLLVHGTADDNVHFQNTMEYADRLIQTGKQFDMMVYPNQSHAIKGGFSRMHLYVRVIDFFKQNL